MEECELRHSKKPVNLLCGHTCKINFAGQAFYERLMVEEF
jgi:hypothetical protein